MKQVWDLVVLTCLDESQKDAFELQLHDWAKLREVYKNVHFKVFHDEPIGVKIGAGGSTLNVLNKLHDEYGQRLFTLRILLLHAGGYSQRQPNGAVLGKIFSSIPRCKYGIANDCMLDLKLEMLDGLLQKMKPGVFLASADDVEIMDLHAANLTIHANGFVLLAHLSPLKIAVDHGVYILQNNPAGKIEADIPFLDTVTRVLQKPSEQLIRECDGIIKGPAEIECAITDSCFYFSPEVIKSLITVSKSIGCVTEEVDAYGDLLQPLGPKATKEYIQDNSRIVGQGDSSLSQLSKIRSVLYDALHEFEAIALVVPQSRFIHIGTSQELLFHFNQDKNFRDYFHLQHFVNSSILEANKSCELTIDSAPNNFSRCSCVISSRIHEHSIIPPNCFVEFCVLSQPIQLKEDCILSNCEFTCKVTFLYPIFMTTVPVRMGNHLQYVTIFCGTHDDVKCKNYLDKLSFCGKIMLDVLMKLALDDAHLAKALVCLWDVPLFYAFDSICESMDYTISVLSILQLLQVGGRDIVLKKGVALTIRQVMKMKDCKTVLKFRKMFS